MNPNGTPLQRPGYPPGFIPAQQQQQRQQQQQQQPYAYPLYLTANGQQLQQPTYASTNLQQHVNFPSQYASSQQSNGTPLQSHGYPQDPAHFQQSNYGSYSNYPQNGNQLASQYSSGLQQQPPQGQLPPRRLKYPSSSSLPQNVLPPNGAPSQSQQGPSQQPTYPSSSSNLRQNGPQQQPPQGQLPSRHPSYPSSNLLLSASVPSQQPQELQWRYDPAHFEQPAYPSTNFPQNGSSVNVPSTSQQQLPQQDQPRQDPALFQQPKNPPSTNLQQNANSANVQSTSQQQQPSQGQPPSQQPTNPSSSSNLRQNGKSQQQQPPQGQPTSSNLPQNVLPSNGVPSQQPQQDPSQIAEPQAKKKLVEKPKPQKPEDKLKDPSIAATAEYLKEYATTVGTVLRNYISHMSPSFIVEPRPISFGEQTYTQEKLYELITKIETTKNKSTQVCFAYIKKNEIECFVQVSFDKKGDSTRDSVRFVMHVRYGEIRRITVFGYREIANAWKSFEVNGEYKSEYLYCRKVTKTVNEISEKLKTEHYPQKEFQITIGVLGNIVKVQKLPCRTCGLLIKDKHDGELPTVFFGLFSSTVTVSHQSCFSKENV